MVNLINKNDILSVLITLDHLGEYVDKDRTVFIDDLEYGINVYVLSNGQRFRIDAILVTEDTCPGHIASENDPKVCGRCGTHVDSLRPPEDGE